MAALTSVRTLIPRWPGHGDLTILVEQDAVYLRADQTEILAGIAPWAAGETLLDDDWYTHRGIQYYALDDAVARAEADDTDHASGFLEWLRDTLDQLLTDDVLELAHRVPGFIGSHPVNKAARLLSTSHMPLGRTSLFALMHEAGWIVRDEHDHWTPTGQARTNGWLTTRNVTIPAPTRTRKSVYPQIYITDDGLAQLRTILLRPPGEPVDEQPHPAIF